jgi:hypothetical protein
MVNEWGKLLGIYRFEFFHYILECATGSAHLVIRK